MISAGFTLLRQFNKSLYEPCSRQSIIITAAIVFLSAPAFALVIYAGYSLFGSRSMSDGDGHQGTMVTISWAVSTNAETKGDRLIRVLARHSIAMVGLVCRVGPPPYSFQVWHL